MHENVHFGYCHFSAYTYVGCWTTESISDPPLSTDLENECDLNDPPAIRENKVEKCYLCAKRKGFGMFGIGKEGKCVAGSSDSSLPTSSLCSGKAQGNNQYSMTVFNITEMISKILYIRVVQKLRNVDFARFRSPSPHVMKF